MTDPYAAKAFRRSPYYARRAVRGELVVVLDGSLELRGLQLIGQPSRALRAGDIHELIVTDEPGGPGRTVDRIAYIGFFEVTAGGVVLTGDKCQVGGSLFEVVGYDETHMPNHLNIVVRGPARVTGREAGLGLGAEVRFTPGAGSEEEDE